MMFLRTDLQTRDYSHEFSVMMRRKDEWDLIRRRCMAQAGRRKGHARRKRIMLSRMTWDTWLDNHLHTWTADIIDWCETQGVGSINVVGLETLDWPAFKFKQRLAYKAAECGIAITEDLIDESAGTERAARGEIRKRVKEEKRRRDAIRELADQLGQE